MAPKNISQPELLFEVVTTRINREKFEVKASKTARDQGETEWEPELRATQEILDPYVSEWLHHPLHSHCLITGLAGSQGPITTFLYFCNPISHQLHPPIPTIVPSPHSTTPTIAAFQSPSRTNVTPIPAPAPMTRERVSRRWPRHEMCRRWRRKTGKRPKTSMLKRVRLKTWVVLGSLEARTVEAMRAALVEREAGKL